MLRPLHRPRPAGIAGRFRAAALVLGVAFAGAAAVLAAPPAPPAPPVPPDPPARPARPAAEPVLVDGQLVYPEWGAIPRGLTPVERSYLASHGRPKALRQSPPPTGPLRTIAEYEPMEAIIVAWEGTSSLRTILARIGAAVTTLGDAELHVYHDRASEPAEADSLLLAEGADLSRVRYFEADTDTIWIRDYGPRYVREGDVRIIVDHVYNRPRPNDDRLPFAYGASRNHAQFELPLVHGGGNYELSASAEGFATRLVANENPALSDSDIVALWRDYQGITTTLLEPFPRTVDATQHLDMWMTIVGDREVIISDWPFDPGSEQDVLCDRTASDMAAAGWVVHRVPARAIDGTHYTYTNAVQCNGVVLLPSYTNPAVVGHDVEALTVFQDAMPGRTIVQVPSEPIVSLAGVLHCITSHVPRALADSPAAFVESPSGCQVLVPGDEAEVRWVSDDDAGTVDADVLLSLDGGASFPVTLAAGIPDSGSHRYTVPDVATARGRVRVVVRDADGGVGFADGGDDLVIRGSGPLVPPPRGPLLVAKAGVALTLRSGASPAASSYGVYEGAIGAFREVERTTCHVDGSDGRLAEEPGGVVSLEHLPLDGGRWFLLSSSDCQGESELRPWLAPWACGGSG